MRKENITIKREIRAWITCFLISVPLSIFFQIAYESLLTRNFPKEELPNYDVAININSMLLALLYEHYQWFFIIFFLLIGLRFLYLHFIRGNNIEKKLT